MKNIDWNEVAELNDFPVAGGYAAKILEVEDRESQEYLRITWDFADGKYKGDNQRCKEEHGFYPMQFNRSYKETALKFFKAFKTAVEKSNPNYEFKNNPQSLVGKYMGVVLGEEEYEANDGTVKTRLYVAEVRSGEAIRNGNFNVPALKKLANTSAPVAKPTATFNAVEEDEDLPF